MSGGAPTVVDWDTWGFGKGGPAQVCLHTAQSGWGLSATPQHKQPSPATPPRPICSTFDRFYPQGRLPVWAQIPSPRPSVPTNKWEWHLSQLQLPVAFTSRSEGKKSPVCETASFSYESYRGRLTFSFCVNLVPSNVGNKKLNLFLLFYTLCYFPRLIPPRNMTDPNASLAVVQLS